MIAIDHRIAGLSEADQREVRAGWAESRTATDDLTSASEDLEAPASRTQRTLSERLGMKGERVL